MTTPATLALTRLGVSFTLHTYVYDPGADRVGLQAALALGEPPSRVLKTLMTRVDGRPVCVVLRSDLEVGMKPLARAMGGRAAQMMAPTDAERLTGYRVGGISPFGQKRPSPAVLDSSAMEEPYVYVNGGQRGLQIRVTPQDLLSGLGGVLVAVAG